MRKWGYRHFGCFSTRLVPRFLALRYGGILASMPIVFLSAVRSHNCQLAASLSQAGVVVVIVASATIFTFRTAILWADNRIIRWSLGGLLIVMAGCWIAPATQYRALTGPTPPFGSNCHVLPTVVWLPLGNASSALFFITALVLTLLKIQNHQRKDSVVAHQIYRANLAYVLGTTITIAVVLVLKSLSPPSSALVLSARCIATVFTVAFGTRAFRNLVLASVFETERAHGIPYPSSSQIVSHVSEMRFAHPPPARPLPSAISRNAKPSRQTASPPRPQTADSTRPHTADSTRPYTAGSTRPHTADSTRPYNRWINASAHGQLGPPSYVGFNPTAYRGLDRQWFHRALEPIHCFPFPTKFLH
ncbi:hypothetical protein B0H14DRAFT_2376125 [Mycena olivaceomarginata]|nr:hypothetical protein B0H14DRAFT_2376125 [Mycena olivaceomarginata]